MGRHVAAVHEAPGNPSQSPWFTAAQGRTGEQMRRWASSRGHPALYSPLPPRPHLSCLSLTFPSSHCSTAPQEDFKLGFSQKAKKISGGLQAREASASLSHPGLRLSAGPTRCCPGPSYVPMRKRSELGPTVLCQNGLA